MRGIQAVPLLLVAVAQAQAPAGPMPPEALVLPAEGLVLGIDARALFASALWTQVSSGKLAGLEGSLPSEQIQKTQLELRDNIAKGLAEAEKGTGLRLDRDIDRAVIAVAGLDQKSPLVAVVADILKDQDHPIDLAFAILDRGNICLHRNGTFFPIEQEPVEVCFIRRRQGLAIQAEDPDGLL